MSATVEQPSPAPPVRSRSDDRRKALILGALATALLTLLFFSLFWNRFAGLRSGNGSFGSGTMLLAGKLPYRDYFMAATPFDVMKSAAVLWLFGNKLVVLRAFAVFERTILALLVYFWLARLFRPSYAALASIVAIVVSAGDLADPLASYNHHTILWAVASGLLASCAIDAESDRRTVVFSLLAGVAAGLSFWTKQTIGLGASAAIFVIAGVSIWHLARPRRALMFAGAFAAGWAIPTAAILAWLERMSLLASFVQQSFVKGPSAKSLGFGAFLRRCIMATEMIGLPAFIGLIGALLLIALVLRSGKSEDRRSDDPRRLAAVFAAGLAAILCAVVLARADVYPLVLFPRGSIHFTVLGIILLALVYAAPFLLGRLSRRQSQYGLLAGVSFAVAFMLALSWPAFEAMVIPGLGFLTAAAIHGAGKRTRVALYAVCGLLVFTETAAKLQIPFGFSGWVEPPVKMATARSELPVLEGLRLAPVTVRLIDGTTRIIREHSSPADEIFVYPGLSSIYVFSNRAWATQSPEHNLDVVNDEFARAEAAMLLEKRPAVIVYYRQPKGVLVFEEGLWRRWRPSGQRDIIAAIETLAHEYRLAGEFPGPSKDKYKDEEVLVYVRP